jgi:hypothetical protein
MMDEKTDDPCPAAARQLLTGVIDTLRNATTDQLLEIGRQMVAADEQERIDRCRRRHRRRRLHTRFDRWEDPRLYDR